MYNIIPNICSYLITVIYYNNIENFRYYNYLAVFLYILSLYVIEFDMQLSKYYKFFS